MSGTEKKSSLGLTVLRLLARAVGFVLVLLWRYRLTVVLVVGFGLLARYDGGLAVLAAIWLLCVAASGFFVPDLEPVKNFLLSDFLRAARRRRRDRAQARANEFLTFDGLVPEPKEEGSAYPAYLWDDGEDVATLEVNVNDLPSVTRSAVAQYCEDHKEAFSAALTSAKTQVDGRTRVRFFRTDPLATATRARQTSDVETDFDRFSVRPYVNEDGARPELRFKNVAGVLIGGQTSSGKTASSLATFVPYIVKGSEAGRVELFGIVDGKSGGDWNALEPLSKHGLVKEAADGDLLDFLQRVDELLAAFLTEMKARFALADEKGVAHLWDEPDSVHSLLIVDECQQIFEKLPSSMKEENKLVASITQKTASVIRRGRAVGLTIVLMTQRPSVDSIPAVIRSNCALRIGFKVADSDSSRMIFGTLSDEGFYPHQIKGQDAESTAGIAAIAGESGSPERVRFCYCDTKKKDAEFMVSEICT